MKVESIVFGLLAVFCAVVTPIYWFTSHDPTGTAALAISGGLGLLIGGYLGFTARRLGPRPQDLPDAEVEEGAGDLGHFSPGSYYPFFIGASTTLILLGIIFGVWLALLGAAMLLVFVTALLFEYYVHPPPIDTDSTPHH
jgi:hypothetical protein